MGRALVLRTAVVAAIGAGLAKLLISCVDLESLGNGPPDGEAPDVIDSAVPGPDVVDPCQHAQPAATSDIDDDAGDFPTFVLAIDVVTVDPTKVAGLDLDDRCTCDTRPGSPADGGPSCVAKTVTCDGDGGADNNLGAVAATAAPVLKLEEVANRVIGAGHRTVLIQIAKYNGLANDKEVQVGTLVAEGIHSQGCDASVFEPPKQVWSAGRCGDDSWAISPASVVASGTLLPFSFGTGYVRNHQLVVRLNHPTLLPFNDETSINFQAPTLTGRLVPLGEDLAPRDPARAPTEKEKRLYRLENGVITGRVIATEILHTIGSLLQSTTGTRICTSALLFEGIRQTICESTDVQAQGAPPFDPSKSCDALSAALGFVAIPAVPDYVTDAAVPNTGCEAIDAAAFLCP